jgi:hypothetical protein
LIFHIVLRAQYSGEKNSFPTVFEANRGATLLRKKNTKEFLNMKKTVLLLLIALLALTLFSGCEDQGLQKGNLILSLACDKFSRVDRNLAPSDEKLEIASYHITGTGPQNGTIDIDATSSSITLGNLAIGKWNLAAEALNSTGDILAKGSVSTILSKATASAVITLDQLSGEGSLAVGFLWDVEQVADDVHLDIVLTDQGGNTIATEAATMDKVNGTAIFSVTSLPAGSYRLQAKLYSQGLVVCGVAEAIRIIENTETEGALILTIGDLSTSFSVTIVNDTMMPLQGDIECNPSTPEAGEQVCMTFIPTNLPQGVSTASLTATWYCEGDIVTSNGFTCTCIPAAGTHRYDIIVESEKLGSVGSTTLLVSMPVQ